MRGERERVERTSLVLEPPRDVRRSDSHVSLIVAWGELVFTVGVEFRVEEWDEGRRRRATIMIAVRNMGIEGMLVVDFWEERTLRMTTRGGRGEVYKGYGG